MLPIVCKIMEQSDSITLGTLTYFSSRHFSFSRSHAPAWECIPYGFPRRSMGTRDILPRPPKGIAGMPNHAFAWLNEKRWKNRGRKSEIIGFCWLRVSSFELNPEPLFSLSICFSFDVGRSMFDVGRSSFNMFDVGRSSFFSPSWAKITQHLWDRSSQFLITAFDIITCLVWIFKL